MRIIRFFAHNTSFDRYEQNFVYNLLMHLKCGEIDPDYRPAHGLRARTSTQQGRASRSRQRKSTS